MSTVSLSANHDDNNSSLRKTEGNTQITKFHHFGHVLQDKKFQNFFSSDFDSPYARNYSWGEDACIYKWEEYINIKSPIYILNI